MRTPTDPMPWAVNARCRPYRTDLWFPIDNDRNGNPIVEPIVLDICNACPVADQCLDYALANDVDGIWARTTPKQRRKLRRLRGITARPHDHPDHQPPQPESEAS